MVRVAEVLCNYPIAGIFTSPYRRARQTVEPIAARLKIPLQVLPELHERKLGGAFEADFNSAVRATWRDPYFSHPGGESNAAAQERGVSVLGKIQEQYPGAQLVLFTLGNLMAMVM